MVMGNEEQIFRPNDTTDAKSSREYRLVVEFALGVLQPENGSGWFTATNGEGGIRLWTRVTHFFSCDERWYQDYYKIFEGKDSVWLSAGDIYKFIIMTQIR